MPRRPSPPAAADAARTIAAECLAVRVRLLSRELTRIYDEALRPHGLTVAQLNLLVTISLLGPVKPARVARVLSTEKSTLSRNLKRMEASGWITTRPADDEHALRVAATPEGASLLRRILPAWRSAQARARARLGADGADLVFHAVERLRQPAATS